MKFPVEILQKCWFLAGPTAVGKTALGIELARRIDAEIISLDSMAIYREMDIGTAKPTADELSQVPHHLIDVVTPDQDFSTAEYLHLAIATCRDIIARSKVPLFVGGTGLYLRGVLRGVFEGPPADWGFRREQESFAKAHGLASLHEQLRQVDPVSAARIHPHDQRRVIRALEIYHLTGEPASKVQDETPLPQELRPNTVFWLAPDRDWLYTRIDQRVLRMIELGLVEEVDRLLKRTPAISRTARQALGYREIIDWRNGIFPSLSAAVTQIQTGSRQFAKRQHTWFRNLEECRPVDVRPNDSKQQIIQQMLTR